MITSRARNGTCADAQKLGGAGLADILQICRMLNVGSLPLPHIRQFRRHHRALRLVEVPFSLYVLPSGSHLRPFIEGVHHDPIKVDAERNIPRLLGLGPDAAKIITRSYNVHHSTILRLAA